MLSEGERRRRFEELSSRFSEPAKRFVRWRLGAVLRRRVDSDDVLQEALLEASQVFRSGTVAENLPERQFLPWLKRFIENRIRDLGRGHVLARRRSVRREESLEVHEKGDLLHGSEKTPSGLFLEKERFEEVQRALRRLSPREREVITLVHLKDMPLGEVAGILGKTRNSTSVLLCRALRKLGGILKLRSADP